MVMEKRKSGDPDFDDKVPPNEHAATVVKAGDGSLAGYLTDSVGPVDASGAHVNLGQDPDGGLDTRPAPGEVAEVKAEVQTYTPEDLPVKEVSVDEALARESEAVTSQSGDEAAAAKSDEDKAEATKAAANTAAPAKRTTAARKPAGS